MVDMTNARAAVYALQEPLVRQCAELTVDRVINDFCVSARTLEHERLVARESTWPELPPHARGIVRDV